MLLCPSFDKFTVVVIWILYKSRYLWQICSKLLLRGGVKFLREMDLLRVHEFVWGVEMFSTLTQ